MLERSELVDLVPPAATVVLEGDGEAGLEALPARRSNAAASASL